MVDVMRSREMVKMTMMMMVSGDEYTMLKHRFLRERKKLSLEQSDKDSILMLYSGG